MTIYPNVTIIWCGLLFKAVEKSYQDLWKQLHNMHQVGEQKPDLSILTKVNKESEWMT